jgi:predicted nucleic acid-binding protein
MYLLDTNVVVHYLNKSLPLKLIRFLNQFIDENCYVSIITQMETLGYNFKNKSDKNVTEIFIENSIVLEISPEVVKKTIAIRKSRKINLPDAIIAATAIVYGFTLITQNMKDFEKIQGIKVINSFDLHI